MSLRVGVFLAALGFLVLGVSVPLSAQQPGIGKIRILLVDETKTLFSTLRVGALATRLKKSNQFETMVKFADVRSSFDDPLFGVEPEGKPYDIIIVIPRGIDDGTVKQVWLVTRWLPRLSSQVRRAVEMISTYIDRIFSGVAEATDITEDLFVGLLSAVYVARGWL